MSNCQQKTTTRFMMCPVHSLEFKGCDQCGHRKMCTEHGVRVTHCMLEGRK